MENRRGTQLQSSLSGGTSQPTQTHANCSPASLPTCATTYPFGSAIHIPIYQPLYKYSTSSAEHGFSRSYKPISTTAIPNYSSTSSQTKTFPQEIPGKKQKKLAKSRRISQRRKKRELKQACKTKRISAQQAAFHLKKRCLIQYGFQANSCLSLQLNFNQAVKNDYYTPTLLPKNLAFHDLTTSGNIPPNTKQLLGLNLNFCVAQNTLPYKIDETNRNLAYSIRTREYLKNSETLQDSTYIKQLYLKNKHWHPPAASMTIEDKITEFEKELKKAHSALSMKYSKVSLRNLSQPQLKILNELRNNDNVVTRATDKKLGPAILNKSTYIQQVFNEQLLSQDYQHLSEEAAKLLINNTKGALKTIINNNLHILPQPERTFFQRSFHLHYRIPIFYGLPKVHKEPFQLRPVVSSTGSLLSIFSTWLDYKMKSLLPFVKTHLKNSTTVVQETKGLTLPKEAKLFSADATSMYTNIGTDNGITSIEAFIQDNIQNIPHEFPTELFLQFLELVMKNNVFTFGGSYWLQLSGLAMGTPAACAYATISYGQHKNSVILEKNGSNLLYFKRYIDDVFSIWLPPPTQKQATWESFKQDLNNWGTLSWVIENPSSETNFLDLNIKIIDSKIVTATFQKPLNLYLYLPTNSAHPPSCFKGLITGELKRFWLQN